MNSTQHPVSQDGVLRAAGLIVSAGLLVLLYGLNGNAQDLHLYGRSAVRWMVTMWNEPNGQFSHGWLVPLVSAAMLWQRRKAIASAEKRTWAPALVVVIGSLLLYLAGLRIQLTVIAMCSIIGLFWGIPAYLFGPRTARLILFPCAYLIFCMPFGFLDALTFPLRFFSTGLSAAVLNGFGIAVVRSGTSIRSLSGSDLSLDVADPCSGLHSLLSMMAVTAAYAFFFQPSRWRAVVLFLGSIPLALAGNIVRIVTIAVVAEYVGARRALELAHDYSSYLVFAVAISLMIGLGALLNAVTIERLRALRPRGKREEFFSQRRQER